MTQTYCVQDLFVLVDNSTRPPKPSISSIRAYWRSLLRWIQSQLVFDRKILIPKFGFITSILIQDTKTFILQIISSFLNENYIQSKQEYQQYSKPVISLHYTAISKMLDKKQQPEWLSKTLDRLFASILNLIISQNVNIDLGILGKLIIHQKSLVFEPFITYKKKLEHRTTVSKLIINKQNSFRIKNKSHFYQNLTIPNQEKHKLSIFNQSSIYNIQEYSRCQKTLFSPNVNNWRKRNPNPNSNFTKHLDMLGEVSSSLGKSQIFSDLTQQPQTLLRTVFVKQSVSEPRYPPILDDSVRTLASSITNQKYNLSISGRIGCNYNPKARSLYFDHKSRSIKNYIYVDNIKFKAQPSLLQTPATDYQELQYLSKNKLQYKYKVQIRQKCYQRYNQYIQKQIPHSLIKSIDHTQIKRILQKAGINSEIAKDQKLQKIINSDLEIIVKDYYYAGRKAILDYALKDQNQKYRIGIMQILFKSSDWGEQKVSDIVFCQFSKKYIQYSKSFIKERLLISSCALKIKQMWRQYGNHLFVDLSSKISSTNLLYFVKKQQQKMVYVRNILRGQWRESVLQLLKQQIKNLKFRHQLTSLQRVINTLMSNLLRQIIQSSLQKYLSFFQQFQSQHYSNINQILSDQRLSKNVFISVKIKDQNNTIVFAENLKEDVKPQVLDILNQIIQQSKQFPSASLPNTFLWEITQQDDVYKTCYSKIQSIIDGNIQQIQKSLDIYKQYQWILKRPLVIHEWCNQRHRTIQEYKDIINQNKQMSDKILHHLPFTIRMNMILVDGTDLKKKYINILNQVQKQLHYSIYQSIKFFYNQIRSKIQGIKSSMKMRVDSTARLLQIQQKIYKIKKVDIPQTKQSFNELKKWINLLFDQGSQLLTETDLMQIYLISKSIHSLSQLLVIEEQRVSIQKQQLQKQLRKQQVDFLQNIQRFQKQLKLTIKQFTIRKQAQYYNKLIRQFNNQEKQLLDKRQNINMKEEHLGWGITKFSELEYIRRILYSPTEFWNLIMIIDTRLKEWGVQCIKNLVPDEIETTVDKSIIDLKRIYYNQIDNDYLPNLVYGRVNNQLLDLKEKYLPLIKIFANKGLKERHWDAFSKEFAICQNKESLTLNKAMGYKMADQEDKIDILMQISQTASKQFVIEKSKTRMTQQWYPLTLTIKQFGDTGINIVGSNIQPILNLLNDQLDKTHGMRQLQQAKIFDQSLIEWQLWLRFTQSLFTEWMKVQNTLCTLYPLYSDQDIVKNFPLQHAEFQSMTNSWKSIIRRIQQQPRIVEFTKNKKMLDIFLENNIKLSVMQNTIFTFIKERDERNAKNQFEIKLQ